MTIYTIPLPEHPSLGAARWPLQTITAWRHRPDLDKDWISGGWIVKFQFMPGNPCEYMWYQEVWLKPGDMYLPEVDYGKAAIPAAAWAAVEAWLRRQSND